LGAKKVIAVEKDSRLHTSPNPLISIHIFLLLLSSLLLSSPPSLSNNKTNRFLPALELLQQASQGRLTIVHDDMLRVDEEALLRAAGQPIQALDK
jgi:hypothetical protein